MLKKILSLKDKLLDNAIVFNLVRAITGSRSHNLQIIKKELDAKKNEKVLDIGCGLGNFSLVTEGKYIGIDVNKSFIKFANKNYGNQNKKFMVADATKMQFKDKSFDKTIFISMLHHFSDKESDLILKEAMRVTKKKFIVIDAVPSKNLFIRFLYSMDKGKHIRPLQKQLNLLKKYFKVEKYEVFKMPMCIYSFILCKPLH